MTSEPKFQASRRSVLGLLGAAPLAAGGVLAGSSAPASAASGHGGVPAPLRRGGELDRLVESLHAEDKFGGTVLVTRKGRTVYERSIGLADRVRGISHGSDTRMSVGSITKMFTAVSVMQLVESRRLDLYTPIGAFVDGFAPEIADSVTAHHLLTHTSGLGDYMRVPGFFEAAQTWTSTEQAWEGGLEFVRRDTPQFTPGVRGTYSNSGYYILGALIAAVSQRSYYDVVRDTVFAKAGMSASGFPTKPEWRDDPTIARPYQLEDGRVVDTLEGRHFFIGNPAGNAFSTVADLARFKKALLGNVLLSEPFTRIATTPKLMKPPLPPLPGAPRLTPMAGYVCGVSLIEDRDWISGHNGGAPGVSANVEWYERGDWVVATLSNMGDRTTAPVDSLLRRVITGL
ncbi:serine hydrolase domain-containing protein [Phytomonospora sp. NPDC050363]|uniref:serine hydrolase domain-containing protein n=1 Tax=Phytomonospora sp. NPDC050363 TaxID=3155642 RepID=UPI0033EBC214